MEPSDFAVVTSNQTDQSGVGAPRLFVEETWVKAQIGGPWRCKPAPSQIILTKRTANFRRALERTLNLTRRVLFSPANEIPFRL
jgi:hypothetical protein